MPTISISTSPPAVSTPESTKVALSRITRTAPTISSMVSPFIRIAVMKEPIWASVAVPPMISFMTAIISASSRFPPATTLLIASLIFIVLPPFIFRNHVIRSAASPDSYLP
ncbi:MAG: hypothetical protein ACD_75C01923G0002 [uncultured bacterium]|nr:MAG: hypothetical protein ACD_75C01923G0002 [uncultured bacterium]